MLIENKAVLHIVNTETDFNSATSLSHQTVEAVRDVFTIRWLSLYIGYPMKMRADQGSAFTLVRYPN